VLADGHERLGVDDLPPELQGLSISDEVPKGSFHESVRGFKRELVRSALAMHGGNKLQAAKELGISRCYLHRLLNQLNVADAAEEGAELQAEIEENAALEEAAPAVAPGRLFRPAVRIA
jgi:hypothetical protein